MKKFILIARRIAEVVVIISGFASALSAGLAAFSLEMQKHYPPVGNLNPETDETNVKRPYPPAAN